MHLPGSHDAETVRDGLIATMQGLKALTPIQMRRVVKEYRYEVGETRMSEECVQYLDQLIIDWKRRQEDQLRQAREEARDVQRRKKRATTHSPIMMAPSIKSPTALLQGSVTGPVIRFTRARPRPARRA